MKAEITKWLHTIMIVDTAKKYFPEKLLGDITDEEWETIYKKENAGSKRTKGIWRTDKNVKNIITASFSDGNKGTADLDIINCLKLSSNVMVDGEWNANAAFICKAVNNYDYMVQALEDANISLRNGGYSEGSEYGKLQSEIESLLKKLKL